MATARRLRLTGTRPVRRRPGRVKFRSRRGVKHGGSVFRAHRGGYPAQPAFRAHALRAMKGARVKAAKPWRAQALAAYKAVGKRNPYPKRPKPKPYKPAGHRVSRSWEHPAVKARKYKAAHAKRVT